MPPCITDRKARAAAPGVLTDYEVEFVRDVGRARATGAADVGRSNGSGVVEGGSARDCGMVNDGRIGPGVSDGRQPMMLESPMTKPQGPGTPRCGASGGGGGCGGLGAAGGFPAVVFLGRAI
jgi:hypothetical protein